MNKKHVPLATAVGVAFLASASMNVSAANTNANPFAAEELSSGYNLAMLSEHGADDKKKEGKCGEGKCGEEGKKKEGKCGEGKCGEEGKKDEGKKQEGKCGEGKCGG